MSASRGPLLIISFCLISAISVATFAQQPDYPDAPEIVKDRVAKAVGRGNAPNDIPNVVSGAWNQLFLYTVADAVAPDKAQLTVKKLKAYQALGQTARTDKQIGSSPSSAGSTSVAEKPGIPLLLGLAIGHGAIQQKVSGTTATLSSSPYALFALTTGGDTAENYKKYHFWRLVGGSATFNLQDTQAPVAQQISRKDLSEYSVRFKIWGDRDTRSQGFKKIWDKTVGPSIQRRVNTISDIEFKVFNNPDSPLAPLSDRVKKDLLAELANEVKNCCSGMATLPDEEKNKLEDAVLRKLRNEIYEPVKNGTVQVPAQQKDFINNHVISSLLSVEQDIEEARTNLDSVLAKFNKSPMLTFEYTYNQPDMQVMGMKGSGSNYADYKLLFEGYVAPLDVVANVGISMYPHRNPALNQSRTRDYHANLTLEGKSNSPFHTNEKDLSKVTYSMSAQYERMMETHANIKIVQAKVEIPIAGGLSLPVSITYANRTEFIKEKEVRGNFGFSFDLDKLNTLLTKQLK